MPDLRLQVPQPKLHNSAVVKSPTSSGRSIVRFRSRSQQRHEQIVSGTRRLTFVLAGIVVLGMIWAISGRDSQTTDTSAASRAAASLASESPDLLADEIRVVPLSEQSPTDLVSMIDSAGAAALDAEPRASTGLDDAPTALTSAVRDDVLGILSGEVTSLYGTLRLAQKVFTGRRSEMPDGRYAVFMEAPEACRGKPWRIRGRLRRLTRAVLPESALSYGIQSAWEAWISTPDSGRRLVHVIALSADPGLPISESLGRDGPDVELAGYFFKREGYAAKGTDGLGIPELAPLLISERIARAPAPPKVTTAEEMNPWLMWIASAVSVCVLSVLWKFHSADHDFRGTHTHSLTLPPMRPSFEGVTAVPIQQMLHDMEQAARLQPETSLNAPPDALISVSTPDV
ncbi:MAG TPA: hypothetical protein DC058_20060 [Planctomycetaceae bacterium]|nr:hypothetical protein [Planctomycetaceae bacterium]HBC63492.1 hypothetical protein [Planctomycetaceae bacterium]